MEILGSDQDKPGTIKLRPPKYIIHMKIIRTACASVCLLSDNHESAQFCTCNQRENMSLSDGGRNKIL